MSLSENNVNIYSYKLNGEYIEITDLVSTMKYSCGLDKVSQQLDITMAYGVYSTALASLFIDTGQKIEVYIDRKLYFRGKVETTSLSIDKESITISCFDYIRNLTKSKVCYNFSAISAFKAICKILDDIKVPYSKEGILNGENGDEGKLEINHLIKNKSAYDAIMMICTEIHRNNGYYYYVFMDVTGNINVKRCDRYWSNQVIQASTTPNQTNPDGTLLTMTYKKDASELITKVQVFDSKGNPVTIGNSATINNSDDEETGGDE